MVVAVVEATIVDVVVVVAAAAVVLVVVVLVVLCRCSGSNRMAQAVDQR